MTRLLAAAVLAGLFCACASTPASRIKKNADKFYSYPAEVQAKIRFEEIETGFDEDMVTMALGAPDRVYFQTTDAGKFEVWAYADKKHRWDMGYSREAQGREQTGGDIRLSAGGVSSRPIKEKVRALFQKGKVVAVEHGSL